MRVYLSGGSNRERWGVHGTKKDVMIEFHRLYTDIDFVRGGKSDFIVIPDDVDTPSATALATEGKVKHYTQFVRKLKAMQKKKQQEGKKKSSSKRWRAQTLTPDIVVVADVCKVTGETKCRCDDSMIPLHSVNSMHALLRKLFTDHAIYTFLYVKSAVFDLPDAKALLARLLENQTDIGQNLGNLQKIGTEAGKQVGKYLTDHIKAAGDAVKTAIVYQAKKNQANKKMFDSTVEKLFSQSDELATIISSLNVQKLPLEVMKADFHMHNQHVLDMTALLLENKFEDEAATYDKYYNHMLSIADNLFIAVR